MNLTPAQEKKMHEYIERYRNITLNGKPSNRPKAEAALQKCQEHFNLPKAEFIWVGNPYEGALLAAKMLKGSDSVTEEEIEQQFTKCSRGFLDAYWVAFYDFVTTELGIKRDPMVDICIDIVNECGLYWSFDSKTIVCEKPLEMHTKDGKLHNENGPAVKYADGNEVFYYKGKRYPSLLEMQITLKSEEKSN